MAAGQPGAPERRENPILKWGFGLIMTALVTYAVGLLVWMAYSSLGDGWRLRALKDREFEASDRIVWLFGWRDGWASDIAYSVSEDVLTGTPRIGDPHPVAVQATQKSVEAAMDAAVENVGNAFISQRFVRMQGEYLPLIIVRHLIILACLLPAIPLFIMSWRIGEYVAKERTAKGIAVRNHWMSTYSGFLYTAIVVLATYPFLPIALPGIVIIPLFTALMIVCMGLMRSHMYGFSS